MIHHRLFSGLTSVTLPLRTAWRQKRFQTDMAWIIISFCGGLALGILGSAYVINWGINTGRVSVSRE
ncbi:MAG: hypothetical protein Tp176DCM1853251_48 [Prokaryotic dsDNA virus sp.]|nr:MAG: hypothetical protein Tp176DCM1853251_48 [Prokaryotic dsDNA virus sp.]